MTISGASAKWLIGVVAVSLCINLFLVGLMAGHWIYGPGFLGRGGPDGPRRGIEAMIAGVPEDLRPMIKQKFDAAKPQFQAQREKIRAVRDSQTLVLAIGTPGDDATPFLIHNRKREDCRITAAPARLAAGTLVVDALTAKRLKLSAGASVRAVPLSAKESV